MKAVKHIPTILITNIKNDLISEATKDPEYQHILKHYTLKTKVESISKVYSYNYNEPRYNINIRLNVHNKTTGKLLGVWQNKLVEVPLTQYEVSIPTP